ncbi:3-isopropylmalate dehydratase [Novosphingobium flavum]|uniref:3-isopropylmalate dehydratase n=1 Tax=Novosphingobium flavum TaxID=1778672 RepID=A0A7X1KL83_9SPHN|nr:aconitase family protein [Novosphingobium flavum]MBC2665292.1 3-isopropylmalate dehydratase [Novosphingobium flavum]
MASATEPMAMVQKLLARAAGRAGVAVGEVVHPVPDLVTIHDGFVEGAWRELDDLGFAALADPARVMFVTDHEVAYGSPAAIARGAEIRRIAKAWNVGHFYDVGRGGHGHLFPLEQGMVRPGDFVFAYDMHCTTFAAGGALALGIGPEVTTVLATGTLWTQVPPTIRIDLAGELPPGSHPRDAGFLLAWELAARAHDYRAIEIGGAAALAGFDLAARVALVNSTTELGVAAMLFDAPPPGTSAAAFVPFVSDPDAVYEDRLALDLSAVAPTVALPGGPERAVPVTAAGGQAVQHAFIGSCGSGMFEDFAAAAALMAGRRIADGVRMVVVPGSVDCARRLADEGLAAAFMAAGAMILPAGCGPCAGGLMAPLGAGEVSISTAATNHHGRLGAGEAWLGSPLTVAASAIAGRIADPREFLAHV